MLILSGIWSTWIMDMTCISIYAIMALEEETIKASWPNI